MYWSSFRSLFLQDRYERLKVGAEDGGAGIGKGKLFTIGCSTLKFCAQQITALERKKHGGLVSYGGSLA